MRGRGRGKWCGIVGGKERDRKREREGGEREGERERGESER